jgi:hypothetical protein
MRLDGFAILRAVGSQSELFSDVRAAVDKAALAILTAQLRARTFDLAQLRQTRKAVGAKVLAAIIKELPAAVPKALAARIDPHRPSYATGSAGRARSHVMALASGAATPAPERPRANKRKASSAKSTSKRTSKRTSKSTSKSPRTGRSSSTRKQTAGKDLITKGFWATSVMAKPQRQSGSARKPR